MADNFRNFLGGLVQGLYQERQGDIADQLRREEIQRGLDEEVRQRAWQKELVGIQKQNAIDMFNMESAQQEDILGRQQTFEQTLFDKKNAQNQQEHIFDYGQRKEELQTTITENKKTRGATRMENLRREVFDAIEKGDVGRIQAMDTQDLLRAGTNREMAVFNAQRNAKAKQGTGGGWGSDPYGRPVYYNPDGTIKTVDEPTSGTESQEKYLKLQAQANERWGKFSNDYVAQKTKTLGKDDALSEAQIQQWRKEAWDKFPTSDKQYFEPNWEKRKMNTPFTKLGAGEITRYTQDLSQMISGIPGFKYISSAKDSYHEKYAPGSLHNKGLALDFALNGDPKKPKERKRMNADSAGITQSMKFIAAKNGINMEILDGYNKEHGTAPHIHFAFKTPADAERFKQYFSSQKSEKASRAPEVRQSAIIKFIDDSWGKKSAQEIMQQATLIGYDPKEVAELLSIKMNQGNVRERMRNVEPDSLGFGFGY